jgi:AraC family transcriptional activator FtrA
MPLSSTCLGRGGTGSSDRVHQIPAKCSPQVAVLAYNGLSPFEFSVACEIFGYDRSALAGFWYEMTVCGAVAGPVGVETGFTLEVPCGLGPLDNADMVIVPPTSQYGDVGQDVLEALRNAHRRGARIVSLCTGAFILAACGLLEGRRAATHWSSAVRTSWPRSTRRSLSIPRCCTSMTAMS